MLEGVRSFRGSAVERAAIEAPKSLETCHHHPQGCPKDCFCPKTTVGAEVPEESSAPVSGNLYESAWVNCNEEGSTSTAPAYAVFLPEPVLGVVLTMLVVGDVGDTKRGDVRAFSNKPSKVPIA